jgi:hypothetical protein
MPICCNFTCDNRIMNKKKLRCGICRFSDIMNCANCGDDVKGVKKIYCHDCTMESRRDWSRRYQREKQRINKVRYRVL